MGAAKKCVTLRVSPFFVFSELGLKLLCVVCHFVAERTQEIPSQIPTLTIEGPFDFADDEWAPDHAFKTSIVPTGLWLLEVSYPALRVRLGRTGYVPGYLRSSLRDLGGWRRVKVAGCGR